MGRRERSGWKERRRGGRQRRRRYGRRKAVVAGERVRADGRLSAAPRRRVAHAVIGQWRHARAQPCLIRGRHILAAARRLRLHDHRHLVRRPARHVPHCRAQPHLEYTRPHRSCLHGEATTAAAHEATRRLLIGCERATAYLERERYGRGVDAQLKKDIGELWRRIHRRRVLAVPSGKLQQHAQVLHGAAGEGCDAARAHAHQEAALLDRRV